MDDKITINEVKNIVKKFCDDRNWNQFHDGKELSIGISTEAGELLDYFRFKNKEQIKELLDNKETRKKISHELVDVFYFVLRFAEIYNIDLSEELKEKIKKNELKYPIEKAKDCNKKYTEY